MIRIGIDVKIALAIILSLAIATALQICYMAAIPSDDVQADYLIDPYFYMHLGEVISKEAKTEHVSMFAVSERYQPNPQSRGVVYLTAILYRLLPSWYCLPAFFGIVYSVLLYMLYRLHLFTPMLLLFPFYTFYLVVFTPSKEAFFLIGFILVLVGLLRRNLWALAVLGFLLMLIVRPQGAVFLPVAFFMWYAWRRRITRALVLAGCLLLYLVIIRKELFQIAILEQMYSVLRDTSKSITFCQVGPLSVCVSSPAKFELIILQRFLTIFLLPFKWLWNAIQLGFVSYGSEEVFNVYYRLGLLLHMGLAVAIIAKCRKTAAGSEHVRKIVFLFLVLYMASYTAVIYFQPTRQVIVASSCALLAISLTSERRLTGAARLRSDSMR